MNQYDFSGRSAVVTGGAHGIGFAVAQRLLQSGARVALWDRDEAALSAACDSLTSHGDALGIAVDVTDPHAVGGAVNATLNAFGKIDALVHSAGIAGPNAPLAEYPDDEWHRVINVDLDATFHVNKAVIRTMIDKGYGRIVNVASVAGKEGNPNASAYSAAKAGVIALTKSLGKETATLDVAVNCVTPAAARTRIFEQMAQTHIDYMLSKIPRGRFVEVSEIASLIAWLASDENSFTTGAVFDLSGGRATY
ncbi:SDR family oxidoreductase [Pandoraea pulmonicola]|uniref:3-oxoacyl-ACP reductase n=1 Tax=Pandoraea pulmonicola TaxID=93221 RepID=A0AAJ4ZAY6_PANPU|nr:SDR family NAD(P)-dependent oxidoreductase [Pandoraea pulmonicola]AJC21300.1 3-oxoacyl-ACP reductase [Pandoraea pulmonicola]SUA89994.1 3-oxoacyl-[acyl-carrier-protein] reductase FabG [Pandoraea pulmonicola]